MDHIFSLDKYPTVTAPPVASGSGSSKKQEKDDADEVARLEKEAAQYMETDKRPDLGAAYQIQSCAVLCEDFPTMPKAQ